MTSGFKWTYLPGYLNSQTWTEHLRVGSLWKSEDTGGNFFIKSYPPFFIWLLYIVSSQTILMPYDVLKRLCLVIDTGNWELIFSETFLKSVFLSIQQEGFKSVLYSLWLLAAKAIDHFHRRCWPKPEQKIWQVNHRTIFTVLVWYISIYSLTHCSWCQWKFIFSLHFSANDNYIYHNLSQMWHEWQPTL